MVERVSSDQLRTWYDQMLEIRAFEERVQELFLEGLIPGTTHLCQGQEAVSVGAVAAMGADDYLTVTYRGHGQALARGMSMEAALAEILGRRTGCCGGVGGSMHLADSSLGLLGAFAIVGAGLPVAVGAAMSAKLKGQPRVALAFFGDGATNIGTFHESLNMAAVWKAPAVFILENNLYGEYTPYRETASVDDLADRARAYAMPNEIVDGQDVEAVHAAAGAAIECARSGGGPTLLECKTYRYRGHSRTDPATYRPAGELDAWKARDPIDLLGAKLAASGALTDEAQRALRLETRRRVDEVAKRATKASFPELDEIRSYVQVG